MIAVCSYTRTQCIPFKDGLAPEHELVDRAAALGQPGIGLTNHGNLFGAAAFFKACAAAGIKGVIGMEAYEAVPHTFDLERDGEIFKVKWADLGDRDRYYHLTLWAMDLTGWLNLCALHALSYSEQYLPPGPRSKPLVDRASLERHSAGLLLGLGCPASRTNVTIARNSGDIAAAYEQAKWYAEVFGDRAYVEVMANLPEQVALLDPQRRLAKRLGLLPLATNDVHYVHRQDGVEHGAHHILVQARRFKKADTEVSTDRSDDGFGSWYGSDGFYMKSFQEMLATGGLQADEIRRSVEVLDRVSFDFGALPKPAPPRAPIPEPGVDPAFDAFVAAHST